MDHGADAIRGTRARTRFVLPAVQRRERRLGLHRVFSTLSGPAPATLDAAARQPVRAVRAATRGTIPAAARHPRQGRDALRPGLRVHWAPSHAQLRDPRSVGSAPWRG